MFVFIKFQIIIELDISRVHLFYTSHDSKRWGHKYSGLLLCDFSTINIIKPSKFLCSN